jgi:predicted ATPase with chaperone activity
VITGTAASQTRVADLTASLHPPAPRTLAETGLSQDLVSQLLLKLLHFSGDPTGTEMARRLGLEFPVIQPALDALRATHQCEILGGAAIGAPSYRYRITDAGRKRALLFLEQSLYLGAAPVPLAQYLAYVDAYRTSVPRVTSRERVREAFSHLVVGDKLLDQVGTAMASGQSMFVYGPPGNGKTVIAQALKHLLDGEIAVPHALEVEGQIIRMFDPVNNDPIAEPAESGLVMGPRIDQRWVRCRRPMVMVGGELRLESLDLSYSAAAGFYTAPVQTLANGGILVIDDFGRQHCSPRELLNRWIVPLESKIDFLTLQTGQKFGLPFMVTVVFSTNLKPSELVDEAFLRRVQFKVLAEGPTDEQFMQIFANCCRQSSLRFDRALVHRLLVEYFHPRRIRPRGCHPRDLIAQALAHAEYAGLPRELTFDLLTSASDSYFVVEPDGAGSRS